MTRNTIIYLLYDNYINKFRMFFFINWLNKGKKKMNKFIKIKCMAKGCNIKIEIELKRTWYLNENNKRIYTYARENK